MAEEMRRWLAAGSDGVDPKVPAFHHWQSRALWRRAPAVPALVAIGYGVVSIKWILAQPEGNDRMKEIAAAVQEGAAAYLNRQFKTLAIFAVVVFFIVFAAFVFFMAALGLASLYSGSSPDK